MLNCLILCLTVIYHIDGLYGGKVVLMGIDLWKDSDLQLPYYLQSLFSFGKSIELCHDNDVYMNDIHGIERIG